MKISKTITARTEQTPIVSNPKSKISNPNRKIQNFGPSRRSGKTRSAAMAATRGLTETALTV